MKKKDNMDTGKKRPLFSKEELAKNVYTNWLVFSIDEDGSIKISHNSRHKTEALRMAKYESNKNGGCFYVIPATAICMSYCSF